MAEVTHVEGSNKKHKVMLYALSTCGWCKRTKRLFNDLSVEYDYIDVDHLRGEERQKTREEITRWNPMCSFPTIVIDNQRCIAGYKEDEIREAVA
ncbi:MAG: glutaredoxin [candidate division Zixibacteria bacterium SM23_81]|nr:MAG: glutaredoxin [candidate division Zixibacteria bacterium SM23_81]